VSETPEAGRAPSPADPGLDESAYATRIEDAFIAERGTPFLVSAKDWILIRGWREAGVPVDTVVRAVRETFEKRRARAQVGKISSLAYCADAVSERWEMERRGLVGKEDAPPAAPDAAATGEKLAALVAALRASGDQEKRDLLRKEKEKDPSATGEGEAPSVALKVLGKGMDKGGAPSEGGVATRSGPLEEIPDLRKLLEAAASKIEKLPADLSFEESEEKIAAIEASLVKAILRGLDPKQKEFVDTRVAEALGDVSGLAPHVVERMRKALTRREVRALAGFPPLTLLHG
jgi:hypothetical protein